MDAVLKEFKVSEVIEAIEKNGFEHLRGTWVAAYGGKIDGGCVLGQGAINLNVLPADHVPDIIAENIENGDFSEESSDLLNEDGEYQSRPNSLFSELSKFPNVSEKWGTPPPQISISREEMPKNVAGTIIFWNDTNYYDETDPSGPYKYLLPTYGEVAQMAREVLEPYKDEVITLWTIDYSEWVAPKVEAQ